LILERGVGLEVSATFMFEVAVNYCCPACGGHHTVGRGRLVAGAVPRDLVAEYFFEPFV